VLQHQKRRLVRPVQVVEHEHERLFARGLAQEAHHRSAKQVALGVGIRLARWGDIGEPLPKRRYEPSQLAAMVLDMGPKQPLGSPLDVVGECLDPRSVGQGQFLIRAPIEHDRPLGARLERGLDGEARLADPRLAGDQRQAALGFDRLFEQVPQARALGGAPHEPAWRHLLKAGRQREQWPFLGEWLPGDLDHIERLGKSLQRERTDCLEGVSVPSARQWGDQVLGQDLPALGTVAQTCRLGYGHAEVVAVGRSRVAHAEANPDRELLVALAVAALEALLHPHRTRDSLRGALEDDEEAVAPVLYLAPARLVNRRAQEREVLVSKLICGLWPNPRLEPGGANKVGDQDRDCLDGAHPHPLGQRHTSSCPKSYSALVCVQTGAADCLTVNRLEATVECLAAFQADSQMQPRVSASVHGAMQSDAW
jgi:hypothetical protein